MRVDELRKNRKEILAELKLIDLYDDAEVLDLECLSLLPSEERNRFVSDLCQVPYNDFSGIELTEKLYWVLSKAKYSIIGKTNDENYVYFGDEIEARAKVAYKVRRIGNRVTFEYMEKVYVSKQ